MAWETLLFEEKSGVGIITLNRPSRLNAINGTLIGELTAVLDQCETDNSIRALVITGGSKFFSAGADVKELAGLDSMLETNFFSRGRAMFRKIETLGKTVIAAISGPALGGGLELALCCDLRVASESASLGLTEVRIGGLPAGGGTQRLPRLIGPALAKQLILTGSHVDAAEAYRIGLVNVVAPVEVFFERALELAVEIAKRAPLAVRLAKSCIDTGLQVDLESGLNYEAQCAIYLAGTEDQKEGMRAFVEKRVPEFKGR